MDKQGRKGQVRVKAGWIPNLTLTMFLQGPGATGDRRQATQSAAIGGWMTAGRAAEETEDEARWLAVVLRLRKVVVEERPGQPEIEVY